MGNVIFGMTMSLDGFIADQNNSAAALYADYATLRDTEPMREAIQNTGAVVMGWNTFAMAEDPDTYADMYEFQVPLFVLTHTIPAKLPKESATLTFTFVTDTLETVIAQAKEAAGEKDVMIVGGAAIGQQCIRARLIDKLDIDIMPVLLGGGLRLFDTIGTEQIKLERKRVLALPAGRTHLRFSLENKENIR